jgi:hypothetical protein
MIFPFAIKETSVIPTKRLWYLRDLIWPSVQMNLRLVNQDYFGPICRVRRGTDNLEEDVYAGWDLQADVSFLEAFSNGGDVFCTTVYFQDRTNDAANRDLIQTTTTKQPKIVESGIAVTKNGKLGLKFDGVDDNLQTLVPYFNITLSGMVGYCLLGDYTNKSVNEVFGNRDAATSGGMVLLLRSVTATTSRIAMVNLGFNLNEIAAMTQREHTLVLFNKNYPVSGYQWAGNYNGVNGTNSGSNGFLGNSEIFYLGRGGSAYTTNEYYGGIIHEFNAQFSGETQDTSSLYSQIENYSWWLKQYYNINVF